MIDKRFFVLLTVLVMAAVAPDIYIWTRYLHDAPWGWQALFGLTSLSMLLAFVALLTEWLGHNLAIRLFFGVLLGIGFPKFVFAVCDVLLGWQAAAVVTAVVLSCVLFGFVWGWRMLRVRRETFVFPDLPEAFDGYRLLHFSDLHAGTFAHSPSFVRRLVETINRQACDAIVFTGDLINIRVEEILPFMDELSRLKAPDGVFSVLGNHDYGNASGVGDATRLCECERKMGWQLLNDEHRLLRRGGQTIALAGVQNAGSQLFRAHGDLRKAVRGIPEGLFTVLLSHMPPHWRREVLPGTRIQLMLAGHTHGGQIRLGALSPARPSYPEWAGRYESPDHRWLYVSQGLGGTFPFRFLAWPEITVVTLRKQR